MRRVGWESYILKILWSSFMDGSSYNVVDRKSLHLVGMLLASQNEKQCSFAIRSDIQDDVHPDVYLLK